MTTFFWCQGYGFVDFQNPADAQKAVQALTTNGVMAQFAKVSVPVAEAYCSFKNHDCKDAAGLLLQYKLCYCMW